MLEHRFGYPAPTDQSIDANAVRIALWQFAYATRVGDGDRKIPTLPRFLLRQQLRQRIGETYAERELPPEAAGLDAVHMLSTHGSKGLEFDAVHVAYVSAVDYGPDWPDWMQPPRILQIVPPEVLGSDQARWHEEAAIERNNLLYVAVSRACRRLNLYVNGDEPEKRAPQLNETEKLCAWSTFAFSSTAPAASGAAPPAGKAEPAMSFAEFETYAKCPLQHWYRYELKLPGERQADTPARARFAIEAALQAFAADPTQPIRDVFFGAWASEQLPTKDEDKQLWRHAADVFKAGATIVERTKGVVAEPMTAVDGYPIRLPWVLLSGGNYPTVTVLRVHVGEPKRTVGFWRPMIYGMKPRFGESVTIHSLLDGTSESAAPSRPHGLPSTNAFKAVQRLRASDRQPTVGKHCAWCTYATICPTKP